MSDESWEDYYEEGWGYDVAAMPDQVILGLIDGYDDGRIDAVVLEYLKIRGDSNV